MDNLTSFPVFKGNYKNKYSQKYNNLKGVLGLAEFWGMYNKNCTDWIDINTKRD